MAEITRRRQGGLLKAVIEILRDHRDGLPARRVISLLEERVPPTEFEASDYPNRPGTRRFDKVVRFGTITSVKAGWLIKRKGVWTVTEDGLEAYEAFPDPEDLYLESVRLDEVWRRDQPDTPELEEEDADQSAVVTLDEAEEAAWHEVRRYLERMNPYEFQDLAATLLDAMGYHVAWVSPPGPDRGLDILAYTDPLGAEGPRIKVQVKRRSDKTTVDGVRSFMAVLGGQDVGLFICLGGFTAEAEREVRSQENRRVTLIDAEQLFDLWIEYQDRIPHEQRQLLPLKPVYYLAPAE